GDGPCREHAAVSARRTETRLRPQERRRRPRCTLFTLPSQTRTTFPDTLAAGRRPGTPWVTRQHETKSVLRRAFARGEFGQAQAELAPPAPTASSARLTSARAMSTLYAVPGNGVASSSASGDGSSHGTGATPASARRTPSACRAAATPTSANDHFRRSIALR